ncbi:DUF5320 domain-containing protein [Chloroflexota bacterium]
MPGFNGTGPRGMGPMTGGGRGFCVVPLNQPQTQEVDTLSTQIQEMRDKLSEIEDRIQKIEVKK